MIGDNDRLEELIKEVEDLIVHYHVVDSNEKEHDSLALG